MTRHLGLFDQFVAKGLAQEFEKMVPRVEQVEQVVHQTTNRVFGDITNTPNKLLSLFVPKTYVIRKGKANKPTEFGRVIDVIEVENGSISDYGVLEGNPSDSSLLIPAIERHIERFGKPPRMIATDRGFWSSTNEKESKKLGVKRVSLPFKGKLSKTRLKLQRSRWFRPIGIPASFLQIIPVDWN